MVALTTANTLLFIGTSQRILATLPPSVFRQIVGAEDGVYVVDDERLVYVGMDGVVRALANAQHGSNVATHGDRVVWLATPDLFGESQADPAAKVSAMGASTSTPVSSLVALGDGGSPIPIAHDLVRHDFSVATDGTHAWFTSQRAIRRVALVGERVVTTVHEEELFTPGHLLLASDDLYFTVPAARGTTIRHVKKGGGRPSAWVEDRHVLQMVADGRHVYWLTYSGIHRKARAPTTDE